MARDVARAEMVMEYRVGLIGEGDARSPYIHASYNTCMPCTEYRVLYGSTKQDRSRAKIDAGCRTHGCGADEAGGGA